MCLARLDRISKSPARQQRANGSQEKTFFTRAPPSAASIVQRKVKAQKTIGKSGQAGLAGTGFSDPLVAMRVA